MDRIKYPLMPDDLMFPRIINSKSDYYEPTNFRFNMQMRSEDVNKLIQTVAEMSGLLTDRKGKFTTHCFRRGGAQHRMSHAVNRWNLCEIKWWGGWSSNESVDVIMKYLLEELEKYENWHGDMFDPNRESTR